ncbi:MAG: helix-turn-helix domain-containing protein [Deltaproteobacteria bacterium]|nr:helix-turn-helix domain-containing protein [Deltaproteobacteria bacterium]
MRAFKTSRHIGEKIKERRRDLGITQERLAEKLDVSYQQIQRYEKGSNTLNTEKLQMLANCLHVPVGFFFEEPPFLAGEEKPFYLPGEESQLLDLFRKIDEEDRKTILHIMKIAARGKS